MEEVKIKDEEIQLHFEVNEEDLDGTFVKIFLNLL